MSSVKLVKTRSTILVIELFCYYTNPLMLYVLTPFCFPVGAPASLSLPLVGT